MRYFRWALASLLWIAGMQQPSVRVPDTPAGRQFAAWLEVFNSGDRERFEEFLQNYKNPSAHDVNRDLEFRQMTGGFELRKVEQSSPAQISCLLQEKGSDRFARLEMEVDPDPPHLIVGWRLRAIPPPPGFALPRLSEPEALAAADKEISRLAAAQQFSGTVLVARNGKPLFTRAVGFADREHKTPNQLDTKFNLGSMNKMFTAVAIAELAQEGKLSFNDPMRRYLPDYPNADAARKVTIHDLLTHTGGTGDIFGPEFEANLEKLKDPQDYIRLYGKRLLAFEPGGRWEYSNYGFVLLGAIIEKVSGQSYYDYIREHVYQPAGMISSDSYWKTDKVPNLAIGYTRIEISDLHPNYDSLPMRGSPAGGGYSTVQDLLRFACALLNHKLLSENYLKLVTTGKVPAPSGKYAYGFEDQLEGGVRWFGHGGGAPGINADLRIYPDSGYVVASMANLDPPAATRVAEFIGARLPGKGQRP